MTLAAASNLSNFMDGGPRGNEKGAPGRAPLQVRTASVRSAIASGVALAGRSLGLGTLAARNILADLTPLGDARRLAGAAAQIIELRPAYVAAAHDLDL